MSAIGFDGDPDALELALTAFEQDPEHEVRERAMLVLTAYGTSSLAERVLLEALGDPRLGDDAGWIGSIALALQNLARSGDIDAVQRVGHRLIGHPRLAPGARSTLEVLLAQRATRGH